MKKKNPRNFKDFKNKKTDEIVETQSVENKEEQQVVQPEEKEQQEVKTYPYLYGIGFKKAYQLYYFGSDSKDYKLEEKVVVETVRGLELGVVKSIIDDNSMIKLETAIKPIIRLATPEDLENDAKNNAKIKEAEDIFIASVKELNLDMYLVSGEYILDSTKVIFTYIADERVDFRELLKVLAAKLHCRIELRQIGARDRAKAIGGLGPCGLPLCCSTFLSDFEGISINMAKNQLLALNISKISGQCGKLICCLKYEDSIYSELRIGLPKIGLRVSYHDEIFKITSMNVLTKTMKLENKENIVYITFDEYLKEAKDATPAKLSK